jgi:hypothetical protein
MSRHTIGFRLGMGGLIGPRTQMGTRHRFAEGGPDLTGTDPAQRRHFGDRAHQVAQPADRCDRGVPRGLGRELRVGVEAVGFAAGLSADPLGVADGFEVVREGGFDVFLAAQPGGVPGGLGLLSPAQGGRAGG